MTRTSAGARTKVVFALAASALVACGSSSDPSDAGDDASANDASTGVTGEGGTAPRICNPLTKTFCRCADGRDATTTCDMTGTAFGPCVPVDDAGPCK